MTKTYPDVIGLNGVARSGKDTVGGILRDLYGYKVLSFSDALNRALIALNPWVDVLPSAEGFSTGGYARYADLVAGIGYEKAKEQPEVRALLQRMGTEVGRNMLGEDIWVDALFATIEPGERVAIVNVRFPNEADAVWDYDGVVWEVTRPGFTPALGHSSDTALDAIQKDAYIHNDGTVEDLAQKVITLMEGGDLMRDLQAMFNNGYRQEYAT